MTGFWSMLLYLAHNVKEKSRRVQHFSESPYLNGSLGAIAGSGKEGLKSCCKLCWKPD